MTESMELFEIEPRFCVDTNVLVSFLSESDDEYYGADIFPDHWSLIQRLITSGDIVAPRQIEKELVGHATKRAKIGPWLRRNDHMFRDLGSSEELILAKRIVNAYPAYTRNANYLGDLELMVLAGHRRLTVITLEIGQQQIGQRRPKIPNVCAEFGIECLSVSGFLRSEKSSPKN
ncbi:MAG: DUF4411 family protein [Actinomycetales bacterium]